MSINPAQIPAIAMTLHPERSGAPRDLPFTSTRFAERLDRIAAEEALLKQSSPDELQKTAESLRLSTLRSSLAMLSDTDESNNELMPSTSALPPLSASLQTYLAHQAEKSAVKPEGMQTAAGITADTPQQKKQAAPVTSIMEDTPRSADMEQLIEKASRRYGVDQG